MGREGTACPTPLGVFNNGNFDFHFFHNCIFICTPEKEADRGCGEGDTRLPSLFGSFYFPIPFLCITNFFTTELWPELPFSMTTFPANCPRLQATL